MEFTFYGHACFKIDTGKESLLFDPFLSGIRRLLFLLTRLNAIISFFLMLTEIISAMQIRLPAARAHAS